MCLRHFINLCERVVWVVLPQSACSLCDVVPEIESCLPTLRLRTEEIVFRFEEVCPFARFEGLLVLTESGSVLHTSTLTVKLPKRTIFPLSYPDRRCTNPSPFAVSVKSSPGGPLIYRSARVFTPFGGLPASRSHGRKQTHHSQRTGRAPCCS